MNSYTNPFKIHLESYLWGAKPLKNDEMIQGRVLGAKKGSAQSCHMTLLCHFGAPEGHRNGPKLGKMGATIRLFFQRPPGASFVQFLEAEWSHKT